MQANTDLLHELDRVREELRQEQIKVQSLQKELEKTREDRDEAVAWLDDLTAKYYAEMKGSWSPLEGLIDAAFGWLNQRNT